MDARTRRLRTLSSERDQRRPASHDVLLLPSSAAPGGAGRARAVAELGVAKGSPHSKLRGAERMVGELGGKRTPRLRNVVQAFRAAGLRTRLDRDMDAWLKAAHAFFVTAISGALYLAGSDSRRAGVDGPGSPRGGSLPCMR
jgi:hypothetical protein